MKKKLKINAGVCDVSQVTEKTLAAYSHITVNAGQLVSSPRARELLAAVHFTAHVGATLEAVEGAVLQVQNGKHAIQPGPAPDPKVILIVNGMLTVEPGAAEALGGYAAIMVNGKAVYPQSLSGALAGMQVNGATQAYPDEAVVLNSPAVIDQVFALRAKDSLYCTFGTLVMVHDTLDVQALARKGARFQGRRAIVSQGLVEQAVTLLDEQTEVIVVKQGYAYLQGDQVLSEQLVRRHGQRLFVEGDLTVPAAAGETLSRLEGLHVLGAVNLPDTLTEALMGLDAQYKRLFVYRGHLMMDKVQTTADAALLQLYPQGVTFCDCVNITLDAELSPEVIREKLRFVDCVQVRCSDAQRTAVDSVSTDVVSIDTRNRNTPDTPGDKPERDEETEVINAGVYVL